MASCKACDDLRTSSSEFMLNGVTPTVCTSLKNDTGFNPASGHNDCTDLDDANDCLIGTMEDEIEAYDVCDWKEYMKKFVPNVYNVIKAIICAICGLWTKVHSYEGKFDKYDCVINKIANPMTTIEIPGDHITYADGVSLASGSQNVGVSMMGNRYAGYMTGTLQFTERWAENHPQGACDGVGYLLYQYDIKPADYGLRNFWPFVLNEGSNGAGWVAHTHTFGPGTKPYGPGNDGDDADERQSAVPSGHWVIQVRLYTRGSFSSSSYRVINLSGTGAWLINDMIDC